MVKIVRELKARICPVQRVRRQVADWCRATEGTSCLCSARYIACHSALAVSSRLPASRRSRPWARRWLALPPPPLRPPSLRRHRTAPFTRCRLPQVRRAQWEAAPPALRLRPPGDAESLTQTSLHTAHPPGEMG